MSKVAPGLKYSAEHEWVNEDDPVKVGLTQVAVDALGDVIFVELPEVGSTVVAGEVCGEVESTKSVSDLYSPVSGEVAEVNSQAQDSPEIINDDPYGQGWLFTVKATEFGKLLTPEEYAVANGVDL